VNILRRLSLPRLLILCALVVAVGVSATAIASALDSGPTPAPKPLAVAVHDALSGPSIEGVSANVTLTDHLLEGANLATGNGEAGQLSSSPLISGASGRLWIAKDGRVRLELQAEKGDTEILYDGHTVSLYDGSTNTFYRYKVPPHEEGATGGVDLIYQGKPTAQSRVNPESLNRAIETMRKRVDKLKASTSGLGHSGATEVDVAVPSATADHHEPPTLAKIEEAITNLKHHANVSGATPTDVAGQAAYTVRISPNESGSLLGGAELSFDAVHGVPLRAAIYSSTTPAPVIELAATEISYGPVDASVFNFTPPPGTKVEEVSTPGKDAAKPAAPPTSGAHSHPKITTHGHGVTGIAVVEASVKAGAKSSLNLPEGLPKVKINGASATELATALGTLLSFERSGVRYLLVGSVTPAAIEAVAQGL
jgi:outer membrane lipoprotein-sorting protein